jgi:hypothetical protein
MMDSMKHEVNGYKSRSYAVDVLDENVMDCLMHNEIVDLERLNILEIKAEKKLFQLQYQIQLMNKTISTRIAKLMNINLNLE